MTPPSTNFAGDPQFDLNMPLMNGLMTCHCIRQLPDNAQTPIVVLTSYHGKDTEAAAMRVGTTTVRVGATTIFAKPFRCALSLPMSRGWTTGHANKASPNHHIARSRSLTPKTQPQR
jgi:CheY-like chemotaxis protein